MKCQALFSLKQFWMVPKGLTRGKSFQWDKTVHVSLENKNCLSELPAFLGPVVQSVVSLTSLLRVISLTVLADSIHNILIFFAEKM